MKHISRVLMKTIPQLTGSIVTVSWLVEHLKNPKLIILDASMQHAAVPKNVTDILALQIPGAQIFDFENTFCDLNNTLPHMMPTADVFTREAQALGICHDSIIVVFDRIGVYSSPRAWWMFKAMGHKAVAVLDGGMPAWLDAELPCEPAARYNKTRLGDFEANLNHELICDANKVSQALMSKDHWVVDARSEKRFLGFEPEPRAGLHSGHMPNAINLPYTQVLNKQIMRPAQELKSLFPSQSRKLIVSCGSGVTACIVALAAELAGYNDITLYDGSWSEWGQTSSSYPIAN